MVAVGTLSGGLHCITAVLFTTASVVTTPALSLNEPKPTQQKIAKLKHTIYIEYYSSGIVSGYYKANDPIFYHITLINMKTMSLVQTHTC